MKRLDTMVSGMAGGLAAPALAFVIYFRIRDPRLNLLDVINRLAESEVLAHHISLCAIANLPVFFLFLKLNAERAARGVLGATLIYAFVILFLKLV